jgi:hypothetical protein
MEHSGTMLMVAALGLSLGLIACVGVDDDAAAGDGTTAAGDSQASGDLRFSRRPRRPAPAPPAPTGTAGSGGGTRSIEDIIRAAQTADGRAIPQGPEPGGQCPEVLVALGFWSCVQIGDTCSFSASGTTHHCLCQRTDGEGQLPSWVCDQ